MDAKNNGARSQEREIMMQDKNEYAPSLSPKKRGLVKPTHSEFPKHVLH